MKNLISIKLSTLLVLLLSYITVSMAISCFECSSENDAFCPEFMSSDDEGIVPYNSCSYIHQGAYCIKTIGVTGVAKCLKCYRCDETEDGDLGCSSLLFSAPLQECSDMFEPRYCIKATGVYGGSLGTRRFCSSRDLGNYCEYIKRPGDQLEYRSCVYTCTGDGCNPGSKAFATLWLLIGAAAFYLIL